MTREEAIKALKPVQNYLLRNVYDRLTSEQFEAIQTLQPNFEYPDWDWCKVYLLWRSK